MSRRTRRNAKGPAAARPLDWALLAALTAIGSSSYAFIKTAVATMPPNAIAVGRLWVGAIFLYIVMRLGGRRLPPLLVKTANGHRPHLSWAWMLSVSAIGYCVPFFIFPWAQQFVETGLAGIYMAFMPIWTLGLAYVFANERLSVYKIAGFALGLAGAFVLIGVDALSGAAHSSLIAQACFLLATLCYAVSVIISRRTPPIRPRVFACGTVLGAAILSTPGLLFIDSDISTWTLPSLLSILALGLGPTGVAGLIIIILVQRAGPGFMSLANYITPICAVAIGALLFGERLGPNVFAALALILLGVAVSQRRPRRPQIDSVP